MDPAELRHTTFAPLLGDVFTFVLGEHEVELMLVEVSALRVSATAESFSLLFHGPLQHSLPQAEFVVRHATLGEFLLFVVPVGADQHALHYEAVFNRRISGS